VTPRGLTIAHPQFTTVTGYVVGVIGVVPQTQVTATAEFELTTRAWLTVGPL